ncbi:DUF6907 domain-containing protein [Streptomyces sp. NPDC086669]|uniref:DUF6907 domain-containing protein n=1 Tax=Streptomyces sp. NPDC086669 TaxID=3365753 RepID=UPI00381A63A6
MQQSTQAPLGSVHPFPAIKPDHRLVPARIGSFASSQVAFIECPAWCTEDHMDSPSYLVDIDHTGDVCAVQVPTFMEGDDDHFWTARLEASPSSKDQRTRDAHLMVGDDQRFEARLTADDAERLADDLIAFAAQLRALARTARLHNQHVAEVAA